jgi:hypothetical protein
MTTKTAIDLFDEKGSCILCSTTLVKRRVNRADFLAHARAHKSQGDAIEISYGPGIRKASDRPDVFKVLTDEEVAN